MTPLLDVRQLGIDFDRRGRRGKFHAVSDVSFAVAPGEVVGVVGESGSGKSTIARAVLGLVRPSSGTISFGGRDITYASVKERRRLASEMSVVFQDPYSSLNPRLRVGEILAEPLIAQGVHRASAIAKVAALIEQVGLPSDSLDRFPRQFSGGQRQRLAIARSLALEPMLLICDEPVSALDLSIQAQIINVLLDLQRSMNLAMLFVAHDLAVVRHVADRTVVLLAGQVMEVGDAVSIHDSPQHPYTKALAASALVPDVDEQQLQQARRREVISVRTTRVDPRSLPGCPFAQRCPSRMAVCDEVRPPLVDSGSTMVACHLFRPQESLAIAGSEAPTIRPGTER